MQTILVIPVKNEDWILENTLQNLTPHVDYVIIADQGSTDNTVDICNKFENVKVINNPYQGHSNKVRWLLLDEARKFGQNNLIFCIDADEIIPPESISYIKTIINDKKTDAGDVFKFRWIQLYKSLYTYRNDGAWKNSYKNIAFIDNPSINEYRKNFVINDHTSRVPDTNIKKEILVPYPLIHFHFLATKRNQLKQAWYRCCELIDGKRNARRINNTYRVTLPNSNIKVFDVNKEWYKDIILPENLEDMVSDWHLKEILNFFNQKGILFFEELQIWHVKELEEEFIKTTNRKPVSRTLPKWLVAVNEIKNLIRNFRIK